MRQFPVKIHHHHAPGYTAAKLQNTAKSDNTVFFKPIKTVHMYPPCASQVITDVKIGSSPGFGSLLGHAFSGFPNGQMRLRSPLQLRDSAGLTPASLLSPPSNRFWTPAFLPY